MKTKASIFLVLTIILMGAPMGHALYTVNLPSNTLFADDFENYSANQVLGCNQGTQAAFTGGWGYVDCSAGFMSNITSTNYYSCCKSLETGSPSAGAGIGDIDKRFGVFNSTRFVQMSLWFALSRQYIFENGNNAHISMETWTKTDRLEAAVFLLSRNSTDTACTTGAGIEIDWVGSPNSNGLPQTDHIIPNYCLPIYNPSAGGNAGLSRGVWHHMIIRIDRVQKDWDGLEVDGINFDSTVRGTFMYAHSGGTNNEFANFSPFPVRFEIGAANAATHNLPADTWVAWHDDLIITDVTPAQPNIIQFGLTAFSAWYPVLIAAIGVLYGTSGIGLARRVILGKTEGMLSNYKMIFITGLIASIGFILILVLGSFATQQVCNNANGATCNY